MIAAAWIGAGAAYLLIAGFVFALCPEEWRPGPWREDDPRRLLAATFWPLVVVTAVGWLALYATAMAGTWTVGWWRARRAGGER